MLTEYKRKKLVKEKDRGRPRKEEVEKDFKRLKFIKEMTKRTGEIVLGDDLLFYSFYLHQSLDCSYS